MGEPPEQLTSIHLALACPSHSHLAQFTILGCGLRY